MKGKITTVSKTGGIQLDNNEKWYNPASIARIHFDKQDVGKEVILILTDKGYYKDYMAQSVENEAKVNAEQLNKAVGTKLDAKSLDIHRQVALKCAVEYAQNVAVRDTNKITEVAGVFEEWLNR